MKLTAEQKAIKWFKKNVDFNKEKLRANAQNLVEHALNWYGRDMRLKEGDKIELTNANAMTLFMYCISTGYTFKSIENEVTSSGQPSQVDQTDEVRH